MSLPLDKSLYLLIGHFGLRLGDALLACGQGTQIGRVHRMLLLFSSPWLSL